MVTLAGWGRYPAVECKLVTLRRRGQLPSVFESSTLIARGNGRSYGDAALNPELTVSMLAMNRLLAFDADRGVLDCEAGILLADILALFAPRGWFPPVVPGTAQVTVGGMIAADVHGKNHHSAGSFGAYVESLRLATGRDQVLTCSRTEHAKLFRATIGGMGLTGIILSACFRMTRIQSEYLWAETVGVDNLDETMNTLVESNSWPYTVAWIDGTAMGKKLGRGFVSRAVFATRESLPSKLRSAGRGGRLVIPQMPSALLNRISVSAFNALYNRAARSFRGQRLVHYSSFFFPLDRITSWNRLYGPEGFVQYQCVLPKNANSTGLQGILQRVIRSGQRAYLGVIKLLGDGGEGMISFPMSGYTLALDFAMRSGTLALLDSLDEITSTLGGRVYLAKDARYPRQFVRDAYPEAFLFAEVRGGLKCARFESELSRRLGL